jgi:hypothetical protein
MPSLEAGGDMRRQEFLGVLCGVAIWSHAARAQQSEGVKRVDILLGSSAAGDVEWQSRAAALNAAALKEALRGSGWIEGRNIVF